MAKKFTPEEKFKIALEHLHMRYLMHGKRPYRSVSDLCKAHGLKRSHLQAWRGLLEKRGPSIFVHGSTKRHQSNLSQIVEKQQDTIARLEAEVERLTNEIALMDSRPEAGQFKRTPRIASSY